MATVSGLSPLSLTVFLDESGDIVRPARLFVSRPQTETPIIVFQDALLSVPHQQPIVTTGTGRCPQIWVGTDPYRIRVFDAWGQLIEDIDNIPGAVSPNGGGGGGGGGDTPAARLFNTGDMKECYGIDPIEGYVRANGNTIGQPTSGATERANADTEALYKWLWARDTNLVVVGGRGSSADGDWTAAKQLTLPNFCGRAPTCVGNFGGNTNPLSGVTFERGTATTLGSYAGVATVALTWAEMPVHNHTATQSLTTASAGSHTHNASTDSAGSHTHGVPSGAPVSTANPGAAFGVAGQGAQTTLAAGVHTHGVNIPAAGAHSHDVQGGVSIGNAGSGVAHNNMAPFLLVGVFLKL